MQRNFVKAVSNIKCNVLNKWNTIKTFWVSTNKFYISTTKFCNTAIQKNDLTIKNERRVFLTKFSTALLHREIAKSAF
jgi:hypothetical protein